MIFYIVSGICLAQLAEAFLFSFFVYFFPLFAGSLVAIG